MFSIANLHNFRNPYQNYPAAGTPIPIFVPEISLNSAQTSFQLIKDSNESM